jgi:hypothetical protein
MNEKELKGLCNGLQPLLQHELDRGNRIIAVDTGWSNVNLAVRMAAPLDMEYLKRAVLNNPGLEIWESRDVKNPREAGVLCRGASQTLSGGIARE